ncbi:MAG TPA: hypothetical protein VEX63_12315 [Flavisolibacter sp.]|nr:hypothetical protein [Flavisolibacter sp.]
MAENTKGQNRDNLNRDQQSNRQIDENSQQQTSSNEEPISEQGAGAAGVMRSYESGRRGSGLGQKTGRTGSSSDGQPSHDQL